MVLLYLQTKERDALLWLMSIAYEGNIREELKEPYYSDGQVNISVSFL